MSEKCRIPLESGWKVTAVPEEKMTGEPGSFAQAEALGGFAVPARVPGNFELDLARSGRLGDPFYGTNILGLQKLEDRHVFYGAEFSFGGGADENTVFRFGGIDTVADVYLNGAKIGRAENMFLPHEFPAGGLRPGKNELLVHIFPAALEARKHAAGAMERGLKYSAESLVLRKAAHSFGWDICPRAVSAGLWRPVAIVRKKPERIEDVFPYAERRNEDGSVTCLAPFRVSVGRGDVARYSVKLSGACGSSRFEAEQRLWFTSGCLSFSIPEPRLWWPRGYGAPDRYDLTFALFRDGREVDSLSFRQGFRTTELLYRDRVGEGETGEFCFRINGKKIFIKGTNWVPADAFHSSDAARIPKILGLVWDVGCNAVRCWGGGVYEDDAFYEWCDAHGILVWQDFMMACAVYPQDARMKRNLEEEAGAVVRRLRRHACICLWAGDNECDQNYAWTGHPADPAQNELTRRVLPAVLRREDLTRPYLPSSPYISGAAFAAGKAFDTPEQHLWGPRDYFKGPYYRGARAVFASEIGYHGCPSPRSVRRFLPPEQLWPPENDGWLVHASSPETDRSAPFAYRIPLMESQVTNLFRARPESLEEFARMSQAVQAEAFKYFIESFRSRKGERTGLIWWNIMDCWPQFSDAVVDYYFCRKLAYFFIRRSQRDVCLMLDDHGGSLRLYAVSDRQAPVPLRYTVRDADTGAAAAEGEAVVGADACLALDGIPGDGNPHFYRIEWEEAGGEKGSNHYLAGKPLFDFEWYLRCLKSAGMDEFEGF